MGTKFINLKLPTDYSEEYLKRKISKELKIKDFSYQIENQSLDARKKSDIHWFVTIAVSSSEIFQNEKVEMPAMEIPYKKRNKKVLIVGNGPAGFFSAFVLQKAGFQTIMIDRGTDVIKRERGINEFEKTGIFNPLGNYAFGEGGAGTFSDGKLTSRSKHISKERNFIIQQYVLAGAPPEIEYLAHPHLGSDNLKKIVANLRKLYLEAGGTVKYETSLSSFELKNNRINQVITSNGQEAYDEIVIAPGHSAFETYRMLINKGVKFRTKNFAIGSRMEHRQEIINLAQWGMEKLSGVKAAEYRLTSAGDGNQSVYSFCMCPGGIIVPSTAYKHTNIVNGMSQYKRDAKFANAACVATVSPQSLMGKDVEPMEILDWLENLESDFFNFSHGYTAPTCSIKDFIDKKLRNSIGESSYPLGCKQAPLWELLPKSVSNAMQSGLIDFCNKMKGFETGNILGLESKTSAPIQVIRADKMNCEGIDNLYIAGEGSGYAGGILSSAADGVKVAMQIIKKYS